VFATVKVFVSTALPSSVEPKSTGPPPLRTSILSTKREISISGVGIKDGVGDSVWLTVFVGVGVNVFVVIGVRVGVTVGV